MKIIKPCDFCLGKGFVEGIAQMHCPKCNGQGCYVKGEGDSDENN